LRVRIPQALRREAGDEAVVLPSLRALVVISLAETIEQ
jgi:hypothetical protein